MNIDEIAANAPDSPLLAEKAKETAKDKELLAMKMVNFTNLPHAALNKVTFNDLLSVTAENK